MATALLLRLCDHGRLTGQKNWTAQWPEASRRRRTTWSIVGAGGHGPGAAYYLAKGARHH